MFKTESLLAMKKVAEYQSFTKAAHFLGQTPMAVSKQISTLEARLNQPLFERTTRRVRLTEFGSSFLAHAEQILQQHELLDNWLDEDIKQVSGTLKIVAQSVEVYQSTVYPWLAEFIERYPELELQLDIDKGVIDIEANHHDIYWGVGAYLGKLKQGLRSRLLIQSQYGIYASPNYLKKQGIPKTIEDLKKHQVIGYLHNQPSNILLTNKTEEGQANEMGYVILEAKVKAVSGLIDLAVAGLGLINLAAEEQALIQAIAENKLVPVMETHWWNNASVYLYYHQVKYQQAKVRAFIDFFIDKREEWR
jgi:DNA-binding transcriptional LysR family regulator